MYSTVNAGIGVLNKSAYETINVGLSMFFTLYHENDIKQGEIFYRWPGMLWYTVYVTNGDNKLSHGQVNVPSNGVAYADMNGVYAGGNGGWLIVEGGGNDRPLTIRVATRNEVFEEGKFTNYSHDCYHTRPLKCTRNCDTCCH